MNMENKVINPFYHEHPLILSENVSRNKSITCYGCGEVVTNLEAAYVCKEKSCGNGLILHKKCGELPSQIYHPKHPQHPIHLFDYRNLLNDRTWCDICLIDMDEVLGYKCSVCLFDVNLACDVMSIDVILEEKSQLEHPSHLDHRLTLMRKPAFAFYCDACGAKDVDMAYVCSICEFWIHKTCALLPFVHNTDHHHHHHDLCLTFSFPEDPIYKVNDCDVCFRRLNKTVWLYSCGVCRFYAHLKCVTSTAVTTKRVSNLDEVGNDGSDVIEFPLQAQDISMKLITPFVMRGNHIPDLKDMPTTINMPETSAPYSFLFNYHKHPLTLVSESHEEPDKIVDDEDEDGDEMKICDVCITPIPSPPYYGCVICKFFIHSICYFLPKTLLSSSHGLDVHCPKTQNKNHIFTLYTSSESTDMSDVLYTCAYCRHITNGRVYECEGCNMKIDVKCASLPPTIRLASHPHDKPLVITRKPLKQDGRRWILHFDSSYSDFAYCCSSEGCDFAFDFAWATQPSSVRDREWDNHPLLLTFDASLDHPDDFICTFCEEMMHPKQWMYHCRECDNSFHILCLRAASGGYKNIKFGRRFVLDGIHPHPLTFNCITIKKRCDICHISAFDYCGLECALCNYLMCISCARKELASPSLLPH